MPNRSGGNRGFNELIIMIKKGLAILLFIVNVRNAGKAFDNLFKALNPIADYYQTGRGLTYFIGWLLLYYFIYWLWNSGNKKKNSD